MGEEAKNPGASSLASELDAALTTLDSALAEAGRSVAAIRSNISQVAALAELAREMEAAMTRARQNLSMASGGAAPLAATSPMPSREVTSEASEPAAKTGEPTAIPSEPEPNGPASRCLRLEVSSRAGSLDLKAVDGSVNENPAVTDVALLDYDGQQAILKLWIDASADPNGVRAALLESLRRWLGDRDAEVRIDLEEQSAAA